MEAFTYGRNALQHWLEKGRVDRRPVLDKLIGDGIPLTGGALAQSFNEESSQVLRE